MAKATAKVQAPLCKFLYDGRISFIDGYDSLEFTANDSNVKTEQGWYDFAKQVVAGSRLEGSNAPLPSDSAAAPSGTSSDCIVIEKLSTPAKAKAPDVVIPDSAIASPAHLASRKRKTYELNWHFQELWAAKGPWAKAVVGVDGCITHVRCKICTNVEGREKLLVPKIDSLMKHAGRRRAAVDMEKMKHGECYYLGKNQHVKNE
jgi:hypothetical protein